MSRISDCFVSVVVPCANSAAVLSPVVDQLHQILSANYQNFEILLIDDGSTDGTAELVETFLTRLEGIRYIRLSRAFGIEIAITAGFETAIGDYVAVAVPGFDPVDRLPGLIERVRQTGISAVGRPARRELSAFDRLGRRIFYWFCRRILSLDLLEDVTHFLVVSRQLLNSVNQIKDKSRYLKAFTSYTGLPIVTFEYEPDQLGQPSRVGFWDSFNLAIDIIVSNSLRPLRIVSLFGLAASGINLLYIAYVGLIALFKRHVAEGWITLSTVIAVGFFVLSLVLATLAEYLGRVLVETKERPAYFVLEEKHSATLLPYQERRNVVDASML